MPESIEMYPGTRGSTQGVRNEITPASSAAKIETRMVKNYSAKKIIPVGTLAAAAATNRIIFAQ
jgi:hypothetical protein